MDQIVEQLIAHPGFEKGVYWRRIEVDENSQLISAGEQGSYFYLLEKGLLRVFGKVPLEGLKSMNPGVYDVKPGDVVGELVLFDNEPRSATVKALEPCVLIEFDGRLTMQFLCEHPDVGFEFMRGLMSIMVERLRSSNQKIFSLLAWGLKAHGIEKEL